MTDSARLVTGAKRQADDAEPSLRPQYLREFIGQEQARSNLKVFIEAAKARGDALDHVLFAGPPGLGKTTLAQIMARELGVGFRSTSGPVIAKAGDLAALARCADEDAEVLAHVVLTDHLVERARAQRLLPGGVARQRAAGQRSALLVDHRASLRSAARTHASTLASSPSSAETSASTRSDSPRA